ncbi:MAG TPA: hypothetical protein VGE90_13355 [Chitinophaga sp.]
MGNFISNLIARHTTAASYVMPRLRGRFEPQPAPAAEAMPVDLRGNVTPSADHTSAVTAALPKGPGRTDAPPPAALIQEREAPTAVPPANNTIAPPETLLSLFGAAVTAPPAAHPLPDNGGEPADNYPATIPTGGTVNNFFVQYPPPQNGGTHTPSTAPEQTQPATVRPLYFSIQSPGPQGIAFSQYNGNRPAGSFPMQRTGQYSPAAAAPQPVIKVSIGRIDVRALTQPAAAKSNTANKAVMSLDDFLKKRSGGTS